MRLDVTYICSHVCEISRKIGFESFGAGLGKHPPPKKDEFSEKFRMGGGGHFRSKNLCFRFLPL